MMGFVATAAFLLQVITMVTRVGASAVIGHIADKLGPRRLFPCAMLINAVAFVPLFVMHNSWAIYVSTAISTIGVIAITTSTTVMLYGLVKPENRAGHFTFKMMEQYLFSSIGALLVGHLCDKVPFHSVFIGAMVGLLLMAVLSTAVFSKISDEVMG